MKSYAKVAVINNGKPRLFDGNTLEFNGKKITRQLDTRSGSVTSFGMSDEKDKAWYDIDGNIKDIKSIKSGQVLFVKGEDEVNRWYPIISVSDVAKTGHRVFVKYDFKGFKPYNASSYHTTEALFEFDETDTSKNEKGKGGLSKGGIAAIVIVVIIVVAAAIIGIIIFLKKRGGSNGGGLLNSSLSL